uniref:Serine-threonine/tyrosine-protein kinase catalytic domain-containing protein n=1 Tax=Solanum lycopersicum TaxID=4081 RepID=A0A3Q7EWY6_SOLLC
MNYLKYTKKLLTLFIWHYPIVATCLRSMQEKEIFTFGVLILEILSSDRNRGFFHPDHYHNLLGHEHFLSIIYVKYISSSKKVIDAQLRQSCKLSEVQISPQVGILCVQKCPQDRLSMASVLLMLG